MTFMHGIRRQSRLVQGRFTASRLDAITPLEHGNLCIDGHWMRVRWADFIDPATDAIDRPVKLVEIMGRFNAQTRERQVIACISDLPDDRHRLHWLLGPDECLVSKQPIPKVSTLLRKLLFWVVGLALGSAGVWASWTVLVDHLPDWIGFIVFFASLAVAGGSLVMMLLRLADVIDRCFGAEQHARKALATLSAMNNFEQQLKTAATLPVIAKRTPSPTAVLPRTDDDTPAIRRFRGKLEDVENSRIHVRSGGWIATGDGAFRLSNRLDFMCYTFKLDGTIPCIMVTSSDYRGGDVLLSQSDDVDVVVLDSGQQGDQPFFVCAMHNLADGTIYASHRIMLPAANKIRRRFTGTARMTFATPRYMTVVRAWIAGIVLLSTIVIGGAQLADHDWEALKSALLVTCIFLPAAYLVAGELPWRLLRITWRGGHPSRRQRLTDRVYRLLGLPSAHTPERHVIDV